MAEVLPVKIDNRTLSISNPNKVFYPGGRFTKIDVINYYVGVARYLLPHFRNRPVTLKRYPEGIHGDVFYEKDAPGFTPEWVKTFPVPRHEGGPDINYVLINDRATLVWTASIAALELHPFLHRVPHIEVPTHVVFDLDPGEGADIRNCIRVALRLRDVLSKLRLKSFAKVSGSKGLQLYLPLNSAASYAATQAFARTVAELLERQHPQEVTADMSKNLRHGKVFIDWSQNADHKTTVGVYSLRAKRERPYVSMPVKWKELQHALTKDDPDRLNFSPEDALQRLKRLGDLFAPVLKVRQKLPAEFRTRATPVRSTTRRAPPGAAKKSLAEYEAKRHFDRTAEPAPSSVRRSRQGSKRRFVIQKHAASHLHYDFRLEMHEVLKSWAVPKGLPVSDGERHTGFETEDHPIEYLEFEGIIPAGEYGGGTVMVWDIGTYEVLEGNYWKGGLSVFLIGKKLKGEWSLARLESNDQKTKWLITKRGGKAKPIPKRIESVSALSGKTMEQIAGKGAAVWRSDREGAEGKLQLSDQADAAKHRLIRGSLAENRAASNNSRLDRVSPHQRRSRSAASSPTFVKPMKAAAVAKLPEGGEWIYEIKWDGYRALALKYGDDVRLLSLKEKNLTTDFPEVATAVSQLQAETAVVDGEIVAVNAEGCPSFQVLQNRKTLGRGWSIVYYAFDLLHLDGDDLLRRPLHERKERLHELIEKSGSDAVRYNADLAGSAETVLRTVTAAGLEGIIAKQRDSLYRAGARVTSWRKFKLNKSQEFVIGGYKPDAGSFQSILPGYYEGGDLIFAGKVRQGFNPAVRARLLAAMRPLLSQSCPFANLPTSRKSHFGEGITPEEMKELCWVKPKLVAQISFTEWTNYGLLRHATFEGLREDKDPREIVREPS